MNPLIKNILILIGAVIVGAICNMGILYAGMSVFPVEGLNPEDPDSIKLAFEQGKLGTIHFIIPLIAHAAQSFVAALICGRFTANRQMTWALIAGVISLAGGIANLNMIPHPAWFAPVDLLLAYIPMAFLGGKLGMIGRRA